MKIIEGMKLIKELEQKASDLRQKVQAHCADLDYETPLYADQMSVVRGWLQAHSDVIKEIEKLKLRISKTNLNTIVPVTIKEKTIEKCIAAWILRRTKLAALDKNVWDVLGDRNLREGTIQQSTGQLKEVKIRRYFDPKERDAKREEYQFEPGIIDRTMEIVNATTDLMEL